MTWRIARATSRAAPSPCTRHGRMSRCSEACRRVSTLTMSRTAAPSSEVTMPIERGRSGSGRLRAAANSPSASSRFFSCSKASCSAPSPLRLHVLADDLAFAARLVDRDPAAHHDVLAVGGLEAQVAQGRAEDDGLELRLLVLQREVQVAGALPLLAVGDLAFDPDLEERFFEVAADRGGQLGDAEDAGARAAGRRQAPRAPVARRARRRRRLGRRTRLLERRSQRRGHAVTVAAGVAPRARIDTASDRAGLCDRGARHGRSHRSASISAFVRLRRVNRPSRVRSRRRRR